MPNLKQQEKDNKSQKSENLPLVSFKYDNTAAETDSAMKTFQKLYGSKRVGVMIAAYVVMLAAAVALLAFNPTNPIIYAAVVLCVVFLVMTITARKRKRKKIISKIDSMPPEDYECALYNDKIEIKTFIKSETPDNKPVIQLIPFKGEYALDFAENKLSLLLFADGRQYFCFPKRCMSEEQQQTMRTVLEKSVNIY